MILFSINRRVVFMILLCNWELIFLEILDINFNELVLLFFVVEEFFFFYVLIKDRKVKGLNLFSEWRICN